ncbi:histidine kinase, partial [Acinetobacter baumannii]
MQIRVVDVNRRTRDWYEARDLAHLVANLDKIFRDDMLDTFIDEMVQLWNGGTTFSSYTVNFTLGGKR